jgi:hypothetical protein
MGLSWPHDYFGTVFVLLVFGGSKNDAWHYLHLQEGGTVIGYRKAVFHPENLSLEQEVLAESHIPSAIVVEIPEFDDILKTLVNHEESIEVVILALEGVVVIEGDGNLYHELLHIPVTVLQLRNTYFALLDLKN